jgi:hypothetical protein
MDYITRYYKNLTEELQLKVNNLTKQLNEVGMPSERDLFSGFKDLEAFAKLAKMDPKKQGKQIYGEFQNLNTGNQNPLATDSSYTTQDTATNPVPPGMMGSGSTQVSTNQNPLTMDDRYTGDVGEQTPMTLGLPKMRTGPRKRLTAADILKPRSEQVMAGITEALLGKPIKLTIKEDILSESGYQEAITTGDPEKMKKEFLKGKARVERKMVAAETEEAKAEKEKKSFFGPGRSAMRQMTANALRAQAKRVAKNVENLHQQLDADYPEMNAEISQSDLVDEEETTGSQQY